MVKIRLSKQGVKKKPFYRIVAVDERRKMGGKPLDILGYWNPVKDDLKLDKKKLDDLLELYYTAKASSFMKMENIKRKLDQLSITLKKVELSVKDNTLLWEEIPLLISREEVKTININKGC